MKTLFAFLIAIALSLVILPAPAYAVTDGLSGTTNTNNFCNGGTCTYTPLEPLPCGSQTGNCQSGTTSFPIFLSTMFKILISIGGLLAVVMLVVAGIGYMLSESMVDIDKAKSRARAALWGLLLLTSSWLILNAINPKLLEFNIDTLGTVSTEKKTASGPNTPTTPSNTIATLPLEGDPDSEENQKKFTEFAYQCTNGNGGKLSESGANVLTCVRK